MARSLSRIPRASPISQCGTRWCAAKPSMPPSGRNGPLITGLSSSLAPAGTSGCGTFGMCSKRSCIFAETVSCSPSIRPTSSPRARLSACTASACSTFPSRRSCPTSRESSLIFARASSRRAVISLNCWSSSRSSLTWPSQVTSPRRASAEHVSSACSRSWRTSITVPRLPLSLLRGQELCVQTPLRHRRSSAVPRQPLQACWRSFAGSRDYCGIALHIG